MAEIAVSLATKQAEGLLDKLAGKLYGDISRLLGVREEIQFIRDEMCIMSAFLRSAEEMQNVNSAVREWVNQVKKLAYEVEDCLDDFALHLSHSHTNTSFVGGCWSRVQSLGSLKDRYRIAAMIRIIKNRVEEVSKRRLRYGITTVDKAPLNSDYSVAAAALHQFDHRSAALFVEESQLVGYEGPRDKLVDLLVREENNRPQLTLVAVVGEGGLGKTTIVRKAYESPDVAGGHFTCRAWITVSQMYSPQVLLGEMIKQLIPEPPQDLPTMKDDRLATLIREHLKDKRYVIVFDDTWDIDAWKSLRLALPESNCQSRIMITTRNMELAQACHTDISGHVYKHEKLTEQQSMDLFCKRVFFDSPEHNNNTCPEYLKKVTQDILKKCDGLPLAIVSIAGVLATKSQKKKKKAQDQDQETLLEEWKNMLAHLGSELESNPYLRGLNQVIIFSYNDLPYHVKRCFLYLTKFPEDSLIVRKHVMRLWVAEGFVSGRRDMTAAEVAESYFNELVNRYMILPSSLDAKGKVKSFRIHDLMLQVMTSKSMDENFVCLLQDKNEWIPAAGDVIRRLAVQGKQQHIDPTNVGMSRVRSLSLFGVGRSSFISSKMGFLRVLEIKGRDEFRDGAYLKVICTLVHLKYLSLQNVAGYIIPKSIGNLQRLETFIIKGFRLHLWPPEIVKLQQLRFLSITNSYVDCDLSLGRLTNLQTLKGVSIGGTSTSFFAKELQSLSQLTKLSAVLYPREPRTPLSCARLLAPCPVFFTSGEEEETQTHMELCKALEKLSTFLCSLKLTASDSIGLEFLRNVSTPFPKLESLRLGGRFGTLPEWIIKSTKLLKLYLYGTALGNDAINLLGTLPNLVRLELSEIELVDDRRVYFSAQKFRSLRILHFNFGNITSLNFENETLPSLESLSMGISFSGYQEDRISGIQYLNSLKTIDLVYPSQAFMESVKTALEEHPNHPQLSVRM